MNDVAQQQHKEQWWINYLREGVRMHFPKRNHWDGLQRQSSRAWVRHYIRQIRIMEGRV